MDKSLHLTTDNLILFMDRELDKAATFSAEQHLLECVECGNRLKALQVGSSAHANYQEAVLKPALAVPVHGWALLGARLKPEKRTLGGLWWAVAAVAGMLSLVWWYMPMHAEPSAQQILNKAAAGSQPVRGDIVFQTSRYRFARPAISDAGPSEARFQRVQALFVQAGYSWRDPLSARSFLNWRQHLPEKRDFVTAIYEESGRKFYRVRTRTDAGILHSASLTLEAASYKTTHASFEFQAEDLIEISEKSGTTASSMQETQAIVPLPRTKVTEAVAGPEDELRVFAALDAIGADTDDPIDVKLDAGHHAVLVTGLGIAVERRKQIEAALASLPNTTVRFRSGTPLDNPSASAAAAESTPDAAAAQFRKHLEDLAGGVRPLETMTDQSIESSNALLSQSHLLLVLAQEFPPPVEASLASANANTLLALRQRHLGAMSYALRRLRDQLKPLQIEDVLITEATNASWQDTAAKLYEASRNLDRMVSRLLAGSYDHQDGEMMLKQLPDNLSRVESLVRADSR